MRARSFSPQTSSHIVQFYNQDASLVEAISGLLHHTLLKAQSAVVIGAQAHRTAIDSLLLQTLPALPQFRDAGRYLSINATATLAKFANNDCLDEARFKQLVDEIIEQAISCSADDRVLIFGEMVALLCAAGNFAGAIKLERLWNCVAQKYQFDLICAYPLSAFATTSGANDLIHVCAEHTLAIPADGPL